ncbi:hypothetical protein QBC35DRAFT_448665 [Podospora australis]|uniref:Uncharacterized protein n=1 Tax=Podospora australis TaxID=1536484 RepID=A0AAN7AMN8_9PEZI|nr:hypothetical protein QBC35DRAFT_448665 [Podospora australis]
MTSAQASPAQNQPMAVGQQQNVQQPQRAHLQTAQPAGFQPMNPQQPHPESELGLRGGNRGGLCPGRFCFCVPCPLPCDCCII